MKVKGLDRVAIVVRDMDKAIEFFSNKLGAEFQELPGGEAMGMRVGISIDNQMELVSPILPLPEGAPPHLKRWAKLLEGRDNVLAALAFKVDDADSAAVEAEEQGMRVETKFDIPEIPGWPIRNLKELIMAEEDTLGIPMAFIKYDLV